ncbi:hypothetical protein ACUXQ2_003021 [Cupriavidus metallidurans]
MRLSLRPTLIQAERRLEVQVPHGCRTSLPLRIFSASTHGARRIPLKYKGWRGFLRELFSLVVRRTFARNLCMGVDMSQRCDTDFGRQANRPVAPEKNARNSTCYEGTSDTLKTATRVTTVKQRCHRPPTTTPQGTGKPDQSVSASSCCKRVKPGSASISRRPRVKESPLRPVFSCVWRTFDAVSQHMWSQIVLRTPRVRLMLAAMSDLKYITRV